MQRGLKYRCKAQEDGYLNWCNRMARGSLVVCWGSVLSMGLALLVPGDWNWATKTLIAGLSFLLFLVAALTHISVIVVGALLAKGDGPWQFGVRQLLMVTTFVAV